MGFITSMFKPKQQQVQYIDRPVETKAVEAVPAVETKQVELDAATSEIRRLQTIKTGRLSTLVSAGDLNEETNKKTLLGA